jgi:hypothetical protein
MNDKFVTVKHIINRAVNRYDRIQIEIFSYSNPLKFSLSISIKIFFTYTLPLSIKISGNEWVIVDNR